jgi:hypothetical protein
MLVIRNTNYLQSSPITHLQVLSQQLTAVRLENKFLIFRARSSSSPYSFFTKPLLLAQSDPAHSFTAFYPKIAVFLHSHVRLGLQSLRCRDVSQQTFYKHFSNKKLSSRLRPAHRLLPRKSSSLHSRCLSLGLLHCTGDKVNKQPISDSFKLEVRRSSEFLDKLIILYAVLTFWGVITNLGFASPCIIIL